MAAAFRQTEQCLAPRSMRRRLPPWTRSERFVREPAPRLLLHAKRYSRPLRVAPARSPRRDSDRFRKSHRTLSTAASCAAHRLGTSARTRANRRKMRGHGRVLVTDHPAARKSCRSEQSSLFRRLLAGLWIALHTREVAGSKPAAPIADSWLCSVDSHAASRSVASSSAESVPTTCPLAASTRRAARDRARRRRGRGARR
jgi:hypothetical protein